MNCARFSNVMFALAIALAAAGCGDASSGGGTFITAVPTNDPLYGDQWHLKNTGQGGGTAGEDANVEPVWSSGRKGEGIRIAIVDGGLEIAHEDLQANVVAGASHNYLHAANSCVAPCSPNGLGTTDPAPTAADDHHGTAVAGVAAARDLNNLGGRGAAPRAQLVGYNLIASGGNVTSNEADAMTRNAALVHVSNNSWGADDDGQLHASSSLWKTAIGTGLTTGRGGRGTIYVWSAGNGGPTVDNSNYDGRANYRGVIATCAVGDDGKKADYSEEGANLWVCAPSRGRANHGITTTDRTGSQGSNQTGASPNISNTNYTNDFNGTSSSAPLLSGVVALMLQANPNLGWRDVRLILAETARKNDPTDSDWRVNGAGRNINHKYGFGVVDAQAAVTRALTWTNVGAEQTFPTALRSPNLPIPDNDATGVSDAMTVSGSGIAQIEWIEIPFSAADHTRHGDLELTLTNNMTGVSSGLAKTHLCGQLDNAGQFVQEPCSSTYNSWVFGSARHLGEAADGTWTLTVKDLATGDTGTFQSWKLTFYGR